MHSFCYIDSNCTESYTVKIDTAILFVPAIYPEIDFYQGINYVSFTVHPGEEGVYTFFENRYSDCHVLTIRIFNGQNEDEQIAQYISAFGEEHVTVLGSGLHEPEQLLLSSDSVLYLKSGAYLKMKHGDKSGGAIRAENFENNVLDGKGILDCSNLSWHERNGIEFMLGKNLTIRNITILNSANWSCYLYNVFHVDLTGITIFGSRQNGDGIDVCNSRNVRIGNCFVRAGDDCFNVKTLGNPDDTPCEDITFNHNVAWATKAHAAGLTGEMNCDIRNIVFDDLTVIRCDADWNDKRIGALAIVQEEGQGNVENVFFNNIRIVDAQCPPILLSVLSDRTDVKMRNIHFENIDYNSRKKISVYRCSDTNQIDYYLRNITKNHKPVSTKAG